LKPSYGVGVDFGAETIAKATARHPDLYFVLGDVEDPTTLAGIEGPFDYIVIADTIGMFEDIDGTLGRVHHLCGPSTRIIISYYSHLWEPVLKLAEALHLRRKQPEINYIATADFRNLMDLADFEVIGQEAAAIAAAALARPRAVHQPIHSRRLPGSGSCACGPIIVGRPVRHFPDRKFSASILIPCRNEKGNIENAILRMPRFGSASGSPVRRGNSSDGTFEECEACSRCLQGQLGYQGAETGRQGQGRCGPQDLPRRPATC